jgi:carbonic anhydrase/acetyltransferase-like protein (isoleucine patch superfamily)
MIRSYKGIRPKLGARVYVDPSAQVIGDVELGDHASVWMNTVLRGDVHFIRIGAYTNIQDNCVVHVQAPEYPAVVADHVTVGHSVNLHGCRVGAGCLIGIGAIVLNGAEIGAESIVAAGSLVPERMHVPPRSLVMGAPARVRRRLDDGEAARLRTYAESYFEYKETYLAEAGER